MASIPYPAGFLRRLAAATYDVLLLIALLAVATALVLILRRSAVPPDTHWFTAYLFAVAFLFFGWFWTHGGQTLGMRAWRMQLRDRNGNTIGWLQALRRYVCACLSWASIVGVLWALVDRQRRSVHDILSDTEIVVLPQEPRTPR